MTRKVIWNLKIDIYLNQFISSIKMMKLLNYPLISLSAEDKILP